MYYGTVNISGTAVIGGSAENANTAMTYGGGICINTGTLNMSGGEVSYNRAESGANRGAGGGIFNCWGAVDISGTAKIIHNYAESSGGGIGLFGGRVSVPGYGAGSTSMYIHGTGVEISNNFAGGSGGAFYNYGNGGYTSSVIIEGAKFEGNSTAGTGGAIYNVTATGGNAPLNITNAQFIGNSADIYGGAIHNRKPGSTATITNTAFTGNKASRGGAIFNNDDSASESGAAVIVTGGEITGNEATEYGGAIFSAQTVDDASTLTVNAGTKIYNNTAATGAADIFAYVPANVTLADGTYAGTLSDGEITDGWYYDYEGSRWTKETGSQVIVNAGIMQPAEEKTSLSLMSAYSDGYIVHFNSNPIFEGTAFTTVAGTMDDQKIPYDMEKALSANKFIETTTPTPLYRFSHWNTKPDGTGTSYSDKEKVKNLCDPADTENREITLYAQWKVFKYLVSYDANGGTGTVPTDSNEYDYEATVTVLSAGELAKSGYVYTGWNTKSDGTGTHYAAENTFQITADVTLYAEWAVAKRTVGGVDTYYSTVQAALDYDGSDAYTVTLLTDITSATMGANPLSVSKTVTLDLDGYVINAEQTNRVITVSSGGNLTLTDSNTTRTHADASLPAGGILTGGLGGSGQHGGGVLVDGGTFTMAAGTITGCQAPYGGAVNVVGAGTFTLMDGGVITNCSSTAHGGAVALGDNTATTGTFNMKGGVIKECTTTGTGSGGGVYLKAGCVFNMEGGAIENCVINHTYGAGGGVSVNGGGIFTMKQGTIQNCKTLASTGGGGVYLAYGTFSMEGGVIQGCEAVKGGGVQINNVSADFRLKGGEIKNNTSTGTGGGINIQNGSLTLTGGTISGNTATTNGNGIFVDTYGTLSVAGNPVVSGNTGSNIYLPDAKYLTVTGALTGRNGGMGVTLGTADGSGVFTNTAAGDVDKNIASKFASDNPDYGVGKYPADHAANPGQLYLGGTPFTVTYYNNFEPAETKEEKYDSGTVSITLEAADLFTRDLYIFDGWNTEKSPTESTPGTVYSANQELTEGLGTDMVLYAQWFEAAASITTGEGPDETTTLYRTLKEALDSASKGDTVKVLKKIEESESSMDATISRERAITIDLNGKEVEFDTIYTQVDLTISDTSTNGGGKLTAVINNDNTNGRETLTIKDSADVTFNGMQWMANYVTVKDQASLTLSPSIFLGGGNPETDDSHFTLNIIGDDAKIELVSTTVSAYNNDLVKTQMQQYAPGGQTVVVDGTTPNTMTLRNRPKYAVTYTFDTADTTISGKVPTDKDSPYKANETVTVLGNTGTPPLTRAGYVFVGWTMTSDGSGDVYYPGTPNESFTMPDEAVTLYAKWRTAVAELTVGTSPSTYYLSLHEALAAAAAATGETKTVKLLDNISSTTEKTTPLAVRCVLTLDLNGKEIDLSGITTGTASRKKTIEVSGDANLTLLDNSTAKTGAVKNGETGVYVLSNGSLTLESGTISDNTSGGI